MRDVPERAVFDGADLRRRQIAAGYTLEELEQILAPMASQARSASVALKNSGQPATRSSPHSSCRS
jgi:hypothetical protein